MTADRKQLVLTQEGAAYYHVIPNYVIDLDHHSARRPSLDLTASPDDFLERVAAAGEEKIADATKHLVEVSERLSNALSILKSEVEERDWAVASLAERKARIEVDKAP